MSKRGVIFGILIFCLVITRASIAEQDLPQRDMLIQYLTDIGVVNSIELEIEATKEDYAKVMTGLQPGFWNDDRVVALFDALKAASLESHIVAMENELTAEEIDFLIRFYQSDEGRRAIRLGERITPAFVAAGSEVNLAFTEEFLKLVAELKCQYRQDYSIQC